MTASGRPLAGDRGSGTVLGLTLLVVILVLTLAVAGLARAVHARGEAQAAADLAALAAATALHARGIPGADPCTVAGRVVAVNGAAMTGCRVEGEDVEVAAAVALVGLWPLEGRGLLATARARAGPA